MLELMSTQALLVSVLTENMKLMMLVNPSHASYSSITVPVLHVTVDVVPTVTGTSSMCGCCH